ncbi:GAF domain-containing sensor histidine kinase [Oscillatoria salina]|uniref:GAF domain-containing sensor histidine kinase n=1 Tax=Oscillatoria salina TaxID=331517 RepID=UPI0013B9E873|nr:GAF domain-containing sensor histidine kinase [Oscillatoria salina]MBZ8178960.1 hypothetical protein [Oscillatoria salina IIICB1]NET89417.1 hypothetical protein [Kamptonema sp. SIO1D9]
MSNNNEKQLSFLNQLSELLVAQESDDFIQSIPQLLCEYLEADACVIWKRNSKEQRLTVIASSSQVDADYQALELSLKHPGVQSLLKKDKIACISNIKKYCSRYRLFAQKEIQKRKWVSLISCAIQYPNDPNDIFGIIDIVCKHERYFDESEKLLISYISNLIIMACQKNEQTLLRNLTKIIHKMTQVTDEEEMWQLLYDSADEAELVDAEHWLVGKLEYPQGKVEIIKHSPGLKYKKKFDWKNGIIGLALEQEKTINVSNVSASEWKDNYEEGWSDTKSEIAIPIKVDSIPIRKGTEIASGTKLIGILNIESIKVAHFSQKDQDHLQLLARFAAIMLDRIEFDTKLKLLRQVEKKIAKTQNYDQTINIVLDGIKNITKFSWINISLINLERTWIESKHLEGISDIETFKKLARHKLDSNDIQAEIVRNRQIEVTEADDPRFDKKIWKKYNHANLIRVFLPLIEPSTDQVIGTLEVGYPIEYRKYIYEEDIQILKGFVDYLVDILELQKSGFIQRIIHELKSPIDGLLSHISILQRRWNELNSEQIIVKCEDMMVDGYLLRYQAKQIEYFLGKGSFLNPLKEKTDIFKDVLLKIINELKPMICNDYGFNFDNIRYNSRTMRTIGEIDTDKIMLNQVFFNLFMNALKYSKKASIKRIELDVKHNVREGNVTIIFRDWGMGINSKHKDDIFRVGFRTPDAIKIAMGSGLGLAISREIMQKLGGDLILNNTSQPTEFHVILSKGDQ